MARYIYQGVARDGAGNIISSATVTVYLAGTSTLATIYSAVSGGSADSDSAVSSSTDGSYSFYVDETDYATSQRFKIVIAKSGYTSATFDYIVIFGVNTNLGAIGALTSAANKLAYFTGSGTASLTDFSAGGRLLANITAGAANTHALTNAAGTGVEYAVPYKVGTITRDMTTASGAVAETGVGFKPSAIIFISSAATASLCIGIDDGTIKLCGYAYGGTDTTGYNTSAAFSVALLKDVSNYQTALVTALGADGFTLTWTKTSSPDGTGYVRYIALR